LMLPLGNSFVVTDIFTNLKRHDLGTNFYERNWDGTLQTQFLTRPLWGGRLHWPLRTRWAQHDTARRHSPPQRRGTGFM